MPKKSFLKEAPIQSVNEDYLNYQSIAKQIVTNLKEFHYQDLYKRGMVIGITGPWGIGKSSLANLIMEEATNGLSNDPSFTGVKRISPWQMDELPSLRILSEILDTFAQRFTYDKEASKRLKGEYSTILAVIYAKLLLSTIPHVGSSLARLLDMFKKDSINIEESVLFSTEYKWLTDLMSRLFVTQGTKEPQPLLWFLLDDVDRMFPKDQVRLLKFIEFLKKMPGVITIVTFVNELLAGAIKENVIKINHVPFSSPEELDTSVDVKDSLLLQQSMLESMYSNSYLIRFFDHIRSIWTRHLQPKDLAIYVSEGTKELLDKKKISQDTPKVWFDTVTDLLEKLPPDTRPTPRQLSQVLREASFGLTSEELNIIYNIYIYVFQELQKLWTNIRRSVYISQKDLTISHTTYFLSKEERKSLLSIILNHHLILQSFYMDQPAIPSMSTLFSIQTHRDPIRTKNPFNVTMPLQWRLYAYSPTYSHFQDNYIKIPARKDMESILNEFDPVIKAISSINQVHIKEFLITKLTWFMLNQQNTEYPTLNPATRTFVALKDFIEDVAKFDVRQEPDEMPRYIIIQKKGVFEHDYEILFPESGTQLFRIQDNLYRKLSKIEEEWLNIYIDKRPPSSEKLKKILQNVSYGKIRNETPWEGRLLLARLGVYLLHQWYESEKQNYMRKKGFVTEGVCDQESCNDLFDTVKRFLEQEKSANDDAPDTQDASPFPSWALDAIEQYLSGVEQRLKEWNQNNRLEDIDFSWFHAQEEELQNVNDKTDLLLMNLLGYVDLIRLMAEWWDTPLLCGVKEKWAPHDGTDSDDIEFRKILLEAAYDGAKRVSPKSSMNHSPCPLDSLLYDRKIESFVFQRRWDPAIERLKPLASLDRDGSVILSFVSTLSQPFHGRLEPYLFRPLHELVHRILTHGDPRSIAVLADLKLALDMEPWITMPRFFMNTWNTFRQVNYSRSIKLTHLSHNYANCKDTDILYHHKFFLDTPHIPHLHIDPVLTPPSLSYRKDRILYKEIFRINHNNPIHKIINTDWWNFFITRLFNKEHHPSSIINYNLSLPTTMPTLPHDPLFLLTYTLTQDTLQQNRSIQDISTIQSLVTNIYNLKTTNNNNIYASHKYLNDRSIYDEWKLLIYLLSSEISDKIGDMLTAIDHLLTARLARLDNANLDKSKWLIEGQYEYAMNLLSRIFPTFKARSHTAIIEDVATIISNFGIHLNNNNIRQQLEFQLNLHKKTKKTTDKEQSTHNSMLDQEFITTLKKALLTPAIVQSALTWYNFRKKMLEQEISREISRNDELQNRTNAMIENVLSFFSTRKFMEFYEDMFIEIEAILRHYTMIESKETEVQPDGQMEAQLNKLKKVMEFTKLERRRTGERFILTPEKSYKLKTMINDLRSMTIQLNSNHNTKNNVMAQNIENAPKTLLDLLEKLELLGSAKDNDSDSDVINELLEDIKGYAVLTAMKIIHDQN